MRKIITCSVFVMLFSMFTGSVFAGEKSVCDEFGKAVLQEMRAYGLCVAYFNAGEEDKSELAGKFLERTGFEITDLFGVSCPCWTSELLDAPVENAWLPYLPVVSETAVRALYEVGYIQYTVRPSNFCSYVNFYGGEETIIALTTTDKEHETCESDMVDLIARDFP